MAADAAYPIDYPNLNGSGVWVRKMNIAPVTRTSNNSTDATETALDTCYVPVGIVLPNSVIRIWSLWSFTNNNSSTKTMAIRMDSDPISSPSSGGTAFLTSAQTTNLCQTLTTQAKFANSLASQYMINANASLGGTSNSNAVRNTTVDFSVPRNITFCVSWSANQAVTETCTLYGWVVEVIR